ncbi:hypothetical protein STRNTR1_1655 [Stenotrophomonas maltophilia]|nr:hypothetical protein STRNTR1_1655 [Stenotrophomonas maltophilia]
MDGAIVCSDWLITRGGPATFVCTRVNERAKTLEAQAPEGFMRVRHVLMPALAPCPFMACSAGNTR